jgi:hypothetical protein
LAVKKKSDELFAFSVDEPRTTRSSSVSLVLVRPLLSKVLLAGLSTLMFRRTWLNAGCCPWMSVPWWLVPSIVVNLKKE